MNSIRPKLEDFTIAARKHVTDAIPSVEEAIQVVEFARSITADRQWNIVTAALRGIPDCRDFQPVPTMPVAPRHAIGDLYWYLAGGRPRVNSENYHPPHGFIGDETFSTAADFISALTVWLKEFHSLLTFARGVLNPGTAA